MTEHEAKAKWCPFSRLAKFDDATRNRVWNGFPEECACLGSDCMAWADDGVNAKGDPIGRCGLAGKL